jgi:hypothetical protein
MNGPCVSCIDAYLLAKKGPVPLECRRRQLEESLPVGKRVRVPVQQMYEGESPSRPLCKHPAKLGRVSSPGGRVAREAVSEAPAYRISADVEYDVEPLGQLLPQSN